MVQCNKTPKPFSSLSPNENQICFLSSLQVPVANREFACHRYLNPLPGGRFHLRPVIWFQMIQRGSGVKPGHCKREGTLSFQCKAPSHNRWKCRDESKTWGFTSASTASRSTLEERSAITWAWKATGLHWRPHWFQKSKGFLSRWCLINHFNEMAGWSHTKSCGQQLDVHK